MKKAALFFFLLVSANLLFAQADSVADPLQSMVLSICDKVESENRLTGNMDPNTPGALPVGIVKEIGVTRYVIAVDSASFRSSDAKISAFMAMEFPGAAQKICFSAQNVAFNPKGVIPSPNTRLVLVSEHRISLGPHVTMVLKPDGFNYVEWDCNGFQAVNLKGYFEFDPGLIYPDPSLSNDSTVRASFQIHTNDIHNFVVQTSFSPFCIRGISDLTFTVLDATADFSELSNAPNMVFPPGYNLSNCGGDPLLWNGFYMRQFRVKLPKELSKNGQRPEILASNLLIDHSGVSGLFQATNLFNCAQGSLDGWGFSVTTIGASLTSNHLNGGTMGGFVRLPVSETDSLAYSASVFQNLQTNQLDYAFSLATATALHAQVLSATLTLDPGSQLTVSKVAGKLKPIAILSGEVSFVHSNAQVRELAFEQLTIASEAPVLRGGVFALSPANPDSSKLGGFSFGLTMLQAGMANGQPAIVFGVGLNFMDQGSLNISVTGGFSILAQTTTVSDAAAGGNATKTKWEFNRVAVNNIGLAFNSGPFHLNGLIIFKDNDPVYGKGFYGQISFTIEKVMPAPAMASAWFGKVNGYRYYYVDVAVPVLIPMTGASIYRLMGGIYYHMHRAGSSTLESQLYTSAFGNASAYVPDANTGLGIKAGVTIGTSGSPKPCNGDVALEMSFNANGGISLLQLSGNVFFMVGINERLNKPLSDIPAVASLLMQYDFQNDALHAVMGTQIHLPGVTANGQSMMHYDASTWYVYIGRPQTRITVNVAGIATFNAYFEAGSVVDPMPPPPSNVTQVLGSIGNQRNTTALANAGGFAFGAGFGTGFNGQLGFEHWYVYYGMSAGAGFDVMVLDYGPHAHCANAAGPVGVNGWYASGQVYAYLQGAVGVHGHVASQDFDVTIVSLSAAAVLQARLPNPAWVGGAMGCDYDILGGLVSGHVDFAFESGSQCNILSN